MGRPCCLRPIEMVRKHTSNVDSSWIGLVSEYQLHSIAKLKQLLRFNSILKTIRVNLGQSQSQHSELTQLIESSFSLSSFPQRQSCNILTPQTGTTESFGGIGRHVQYHNHCLIVIKAKTTTTLTNIVFTSCLIHSLYGNQNCITKV